LVIGSWIVGARDIAIGERIGQRADMSANAAPKVLPKF
jgi:hypothetical protein